MEPFLQLSSVAPVLGFCIIFTISGATSLDIVSTGPYKNEDFVWAAGIYNLQFTLDSSIKVDCTGGEQSTIRWTIDQSGTTSPTGYAIYAEDLKVCSFKADADSVSANDGSDWYPNKTNAEYQIECWFNNCSLSSVFTVSKKLLLTGIYKLNADSTPITPEIKPFTIKNCPPLESHQPGILQIINLTPAVYQSNATYQCNSSGPPSALYVDNDRWTMTKSYIVTCEYIAEWSRSTNVSCWYASDVRLEINNNNNTVTSGNNITLQCKTSGGYPNINEAFKYFKDGVKLTSTDEVVSDEWSYLVNQSDNNAKLSCQAINKYVRNVDETAGMSHEVTLNVLFAPSPTGDLSKTDQYAEENSPATLSFEFESNPVAEKENLSLNFTANNSPAKGLNVSDGNLNTTDDYNKKQRYTYIIPEVTAKNYGVYELTIKSAGFDSLTMSINLTNIPLPTTTAASTGQSTTAAFENNNPPRTLIIVLAVVIPVVVILIIVLVVLIWRKRNKPGTKSGSQGSEVQVNASSAAGYDIKEERVNPLYDTGGIEKEERLNPLYGTASNAMDEATYSSVDKSKKKGEAKKKTEKEERINPLYNPATGGANEVEEAYAEVNKKGPKKKSKGGAENRGFAVEATGDTYAEVNKPKKKKPAAPLPDVTYAEVQKDRKKKKDPTSQDGGLHGSANY